MSFRIPSSTLTLVMPNVYFTGSQDKENVIQHQVQEHFSNPFSQLVFVNSKNEFIVESGEFNVNVNRIIKNIDYLLNPKATNNVAIALLQYENDLDYPSICGILWFNL